MYIIFTHVIKGKRKERFLGNDMKYDQIRAKSLDGINESSLFMFENNDFWVINKPYDIQIDGTRPCTLEKLLKRFRKIEGNIKFCHQLDYATSGCILIARNKASAQLARLHFDKRVVRKRYEALVWGHVLDSVVITSPLMESRFRSVVHPEGKPASTVLEKIQTGFLNKKPVSLVSLYPQTGRRHQLRAHLHHIGHRIVGDVAYGGEPSLDRMMLHAVELSLQPPIDIHVVIPSNFAQQVES